jgi:hypothetical protein
MERLPHDPTDGAEAAIDRAARAFHDALVLACYGAGPGAEAPRTRALLGNVRTTATDYAGLLGRSGSGPAEVREAVRATLWSALAASGCTVAALRPIVEVLGPLLDPDPPE